MRHKLYLDDYTQVGKNRITLPPALTDYYGNTATAYVNGRQVESSCLNGIRYIRDWTSGSTQNVYSVWGEIEAFVGDTNVALGADVSLDDEVLQGSSGPVSFITNGIKTALDCVAPKNTTNIHWAMVDLGQLYPVDYVIIFHAPQTDRIFYDTKTEVSADGVNWITVFDSAVSGTYYETATGVSRNVPIGFTFTTPTPTREIEIGRGNLELTDTSGANLVDVLHWQPSSDVGWYYILQEDAEGNEVYIKVVGVWKKGTLYVKTGGSWVQADDVNVKSSGTWK